MKRISATIHGRVQGVAFRAYTQDEASRLGLTGWVANLRDGSVRVEAEGPEPALQTFVTWLHHGSPAARVEQVDLRWSEGTGEFGSFFVRG
jgi:acylphosphatase